MICNDCVFHRRISERGQDACALCDDTVEAVKSCLRAEFYSICNEKMNREAVKRLVEEVDRVRRERDQALITLDQANKYIESVQKTLNNAFGGVYCAEKRTEEI